MDRDLNRFDRLSNKLSEYYSTGVEEEAACDISDSIQLIVFVSMCLAHISAVTCGLNSVLSVISRHLSAAFILVRAILLVSAS